MITVESAVLPHSAAHVVRESTSNEMYHSIVAKPVQYSDHCNLNEPVSADVARLPSKRALCTHRAVSTGSHTTQKFKIHIKNHQKLMKNLFFR